MKNDILILVVVLSVGVLYPVMCWAHRNAGTALIVTIFTPLVVVPMGGLAFLVAGGVLKGFNTILEYGGFGMTDAAIIKAAWIVAGAASLVGLAFYAKDQRHLSSIKTGPRWGGARPPTQAVFNQKTRLK